jgi:hypothetical protein
MSLFETLPSEISGNGAQLDDLGGAEKGKTPTGREESIQGATPDSPLVSVEVPVSESGSRTDTPIRYGEGHVGSMAVERSDGVGITGDGPGALHLKLPPLDVLAPHSKSPEGSLDGSTPDLYISGHGKQGGETPEQLRVRRRAEDLKSYDGEGNELQFPLPSERQSIHPRGPDSGIVHPV